MAAIGPVGDASLFDEHERLKPVSRDGPQFDPRIGEKQVGELIRRPAVEDLKVTDQPSTGSLKNSSNSVPVRRASVTPSPSRSIRRSWDDAKSNVGISL